MDIDTAHGPELDRLVIATLFPEHGQAHADLWCPSKRINQAWGVVERMIGKGYAPELWWDERAKHWCAMFVRAPAVGYMVSSETVEVAICRAAMAAVMPGKP